LYAAVYRLKVVKIDVRTPFYTRNIDVRKNNGKVERKKQLYCVNMTVKVRKKREKATLIGKNQSFRNINERK
jgi:hypothetical protein